MIIKCLVLANLLTLGKNQCAANGAELLSVGFNSDKTTLVVTCNNHQVFNLKNFLSDENKYLCLRRGEK